MTDEEMAEEYKEQRRFVSIDDDADVVMTQNKLLEYIKQAFLAGLEAGRPKWHKVADGDLPKDEIKEKKAEWHYLQKNPSDLPKNREKVLLLVKLNDKWNRTEVLVGYRDFGDCLGKYCKDWGYFEPVKNIYYDFVDGEEVIAWKEIVLPEENEKAKTMSVEEQLEYAKTIIKDLLDNSDEYARQRAIDFLEEKK